MAGALIVEEPQPVPVDREWMLTDWQLTSNAQIASGFGNGMDAAMSGRVGNTVTMRGANQEINKAMTPELQLPLAYV
jgi:hypothetical protein